MREILFRSKRIDNGEWVVGYYLKKQDPLLEGVTYHFILTHEKDNCGCLLSTVSWYKVIPESIGQFTSLCDKNGKKIFEGDIVKHYNNSDDGFDIGALYWDETFSQWKRTSIGNFHHSSFTYVMSRSCEYEVIGNIHDNPELLKIQKNDFKE